MDTLISLLVLSTLTQLVVPQAPSLTSFRAVTEVMTGQPRIFSGENVQLRCSIPDDHRSSWRYLWFMGSKQLPQTGEHLFLWKARIQQSGKYYCQGVRETAVGNIRTLPSLPMEINVDGGWAVLVVPPHPGLVGESLQVTCRVRLNPPLNEVCLYKDGVEIMRQKGPNPHFNLTNLTLKDQGIYSCRASWDIQRRTRSVISSEIPVQVLEVLSQPLLEIVSMIPDDKMKLICHVQYNAPVPAPPINYYFYKNNNRLGVAKSENYDLVRQAPGIYSCKAKVPLLGVSKWSEPKRFEEVTEQVMMHQSPHHRDPMPLAPTVSSRDLFPPAAAEPTATEHYPQQSTALPTFSQASGVSTHPLDPLPEHSQPAPSTILSTVQPLKQTATPESVNLSEESGDLSGDNANPDETVYVSGGSPVL